MSQFSASIEFKFVSNFKEVAKKVNRGIKGMKSSFADLGNQIRANHQGFQDLAQFLRRSFLVGLAALSAAFAVATVKAQEYDKALSQLSAITGLAGQDLQGFGKQSIEASNRFGVSAAGYLEAVQLVASAKPELLDQPQLLKQITDEASILSKAAGIDLKNATNALTDSMNQFELSAEDANRAINVLAAGSKFGASLVGDTADALVKSGVAAKLAGLNFEQTNAAIQILSQRGIRGAMAGTQLKGTFLTLNQIMAENNIPDVASALDILGKAMENGADLTNLFGRENISAATILIENRRRMEDMTKSITGTTVATEQAEINMATFGERMARLKQVTVNALMVAFEPFINALSWLGDKLAVGIEWLSKYPRVMTGLVIAAGLLTAVLGLLAVGITIAIAVATGAAAAFLSAAGAVAAFTVALLANPITWVVVGVVALIAALGYLIYKWDNLRKAIVTVFRAFWAFYKGVYDGIMSVIIPAFSELWSAIKEAAAPFMELFEIVDELFGYLLDSLGLSKSEFSGFGEIGKMVGQAIGIALRLLINPLIIIVKMFGMLITAGKVIGNVLIGNFDGALKSLKKFVNQGKRLLDPFVETLKAAGNLLGFGDDDEPKKAESAVSSAGKSAARLEAAKVVTKQSLDVNLKVDGPVKVEKVKSDKELNTNILSGLMIPEGV